MRQAGQILQGLRCSQREDLESNPKVGLGSFCVVLSRALTTCFEEAMLVLISFLQNTPFS